MDSLIGLNDIYFDLYIECGLSFIPSDSFTLNLIFKPHPNEALFSLEPDYIGKGFETRLNLIFTPIDELEINLDYFVKLLPDDKDKRFGMGFEMGLRWYIIKQTDDDNETNESNEETGNNPNNENSNDKNQNKDNLNNSKDDENQE